MTSIKFSKEEKDQMVQKVKLYFNNELKQEIGQFDAEFLIDFFSEELGAYYYNHGLYDAATLMSEKVGEISDELLQLEKPVNPNYKN